MTDLKKTMMAAGCLVLSVVPAMAQASNNDHHPVQIAASIAAPMSDTRTMAHTEPIPAERLIVVSLQDRRLALVEDGVVRKVYRVAVGRTTTPSPTGTFTIVDRVENPTYYHTGKVIPPGPENPVGTRWIGLDKKGYGIHGTNEPDSIGKAASHGCIRMQRRDLEQLFAEVRSGDQVEIVGARDTETAAIFGGPKLPAASRPLVAAQETSEAPAQPAASDAAAITMLPAALPASR